MERRASEHARRDTGALRLSEALLCVLLLAPLVEAVLHGRIARRQCSGRDTGPRHEELSAEEGSFGRCACVELRQRTELGLKEQRGHKDVVPDELANPVAIAQDVGVVRPGVHRCAGGRKREVVNK